jgi:hypothetical protein
VLLSKGDKIFVVARRLFPEDLRRHFVGEVVEASETTVKVRGFAFIYDDVQSDFVRREDIRTRIFSLTDVGNIINVLPSDAILREVQYMVDNQNQRIVSDGKTFKINVSEFSARM